MPLPETTQRTKRTEYPGNEGRPTEQVLGWNLEDGWTVSGEWDRRRMGTGVPESTKADIEALVKSGARVSVQLDDLRYVGRITKLAPVMTAYGFRYTLTISPHSDDGGARVNPGGLQGQTVVKTPDDYWTDVSALYDSAAARQDDAPQWWFGGVYYSSAGTALLDLSATVASIRASLDSRPDAQATPVEVVRASVSLFAQAQAQAATAAEVLAGVSSDDALAWDNPAGVLAFESWSRGIGADMRALQWSAYQATVGLGMQVDPSVMALYKPRRHESLYSIARRFYGDPLLWREISSRNRLQFTNLTGEETLVIPVLSAPR
jgi:nucleoid-associated protein YgaU